MKYTCLNPVSEKGTSLFTPDYEKVDALEDAELVLVRSAAMHDLSLPDSLLAVARAGAGVNNIPLDKCAEQGIVVMNTPGANANGVKELVLAGMLLACRDIVGGIGWVQENADDEGIAKATEKAKKAYAGTEILGKTLGVIGCGAIGIKVANAAVALGMDVIGYDAFLTPANQAKLDEHVKIADSVEEIYAVADFVTIHVPANDATKGMINADAIAAMKDTAVLLNFSRDALVDEEAVVAALSEGKMRKYVVDFPTPKTAGKPGCIVIPHLGASTDESEENCAIMAVNQLRDYAENGNIVHSVNYPACSLGEAKAVSRIAVLAKESEGLSDAVAAVLTGAEQTESAAKDGYAYILADLSEKPDPETVEKLSAIDSVIRVRIVK